MTGRKRERRFIIDRKTGAERVVGEKNPYRWVKKERQDKITSFSPLSFFLFVV